MPITNEGTVVYKMPKEIKDVITPAFCIQFMKELHHVWGFSLEDFDYDSVSFCEGTGGWFESLTSTCRKTNNDKLIKYYNSLDWYDSDLFDAELTEMLVNYKLLLPTTYTDEIARQLKIDSNDLGVCNECGKTYLKKDMVDNEKDEDECLSMYVCKNCKHIENVKEVDFDKVRTIHEILGLSEKDYFLCKKCGKYHNTNHKGKEFCLYCEDKKIPETNVNNYYREQCSENEKYLGSIFPRTYEYKEHKAEVYYSYEDKLWIGKITYVKNKECTDLVSFHSENKKDIKHQFELAVDDYIELKKEIGKED